MTIARRGNRMASIFDEGLARLGIASVTASIFDTATYATGADGLMTIARRVNRLTSIFVEGLARLGIASETATFFDTATFASGAATTAIVARALESGYNVRRIDASTIGVSLDETTTRNDVVALWRAFAGGDVSLDVDAI